MDYLAVYINPLYWSLMSLIIALTLINSNTTRMEDWSQQDWVILLFFSIVYPAGIALMVYELIFYKIRWLDINHWFIKEREWWPQPWPMIIVLLIVIITSLTLAFAGAIK